MPQIAVLRIIAVAAVGMLLFLILLYIIGFKEKIYLKKSSKTAKRDNARIKERIFIIYLLLLIAGIIFLFLMIKYGIRGEACEYKIE